MDRAWIVRLTFRRFILVAVAFQAMTPDLLDHTLVSQSLPPSAWFAVTGPAPRPGVIRFQGFLLESAANPAQSAAGNDSPEKLCEPIWPELGLRPDRDGKFPARLKPGVPLPPGVYRVWQAQARVSRTLDSAETVLRSWLPLRLNC